MRRKTTKAWEMIKRGWFVFGGLFLLTVFYGIGSVMAMSDDPSVAGAGDLVEKATTVAALVTYAVGAIKRIWTTMPKFVGIALSLIFGAAYSYFTGEGDAMIRLVEGVQFGYMTMGIYSSTKTLATDKNAFVPKEKK